MTSELQRLRDVERWMAWVRIGGVAFALFQLGVLRDEYPAGYDTGVWVTTAALAAVAGALWIASRRSLTTRSARAVGLVALAADTSIVSSYVLLHSFQEGSLLAMLLIVPLVEGAIRYGFRGGIGVPIAFVPVLVAFELLRDDHLGTDFDPDNVTFPVGVCCSPG